MKHGPDSAMTLKRFSIPPKVGNLHTDHIFAQPGYEPRSLRGIVRAIAVGPRMEFAVIIVGSSDDDLSRRKPVSIQLL